MKKSVPAAAVVFLVLLLPGILMCQPLEQVIDQKIILPGGDKTPYSVRELFMDIIVGSVSYQLNDGGLSSFALSSPGLAKGAALFHFEQQRKIAYKNYERALEYGSEADRKYYEGVIQRLEAAKVWISTGDGAPLRAALQNKQKGAVPQKKSPPSTVFKGSIMAAGVITNGVRGIPLRDNNVSLSLGLTPHGIPRCRGTVKIKIVNSTHADEWVDFFFDLQPGHPRGQDKSKTFSVFPSSCSWEGKGEITIRMNGRSWRWGQVRWQAMAANGTVTGSVWGFWNEMSNKVPFDFIMAMIPDELAFRATYYVSPRKSGLPAESQGGDDFS